MAKCRLWVYNAEKILWPLDTHSHQWFDRRSEIQKKCFLGHPNIHHHEHDHRNHLTGVVLVSLRRGADSELSELDLKYRFSSSLKTTQEQLNLRHFIRVMRKHDLTNVFFIIFVILTIFHTFDNFHWQFVTIKFFILEKLTICKYLSLFTIFQFSWQFLQFLHFLIIFLQFWPILTITNNVLNGRKNLHRWPRSVPSPSRLASLFKIFWCVNYIQVGSSPSNPMHAYSFWVCCGATSICDGTVYNLPQMGTHLPAWYMVWYMAHVTLHTTQQSNEATKNKTT